MTIVSTWHFLIRSRRAIRSRQIPQSYALDLHPDLRAPPSNGYRLRRIIGLGCQRVRPIVTNAATKKHSEPG
jgi:hypothetical protein